jgi:peptidoglycan hydrolase-like protein with peptidoglycan-binding domain
MNGVFGAKMQQDLQDFQQFHALEITGTADLGTWWSLLTSHGDQGRPASGADCAMILNQARAKTLYDYGFRIVGRYLTNVPGGLDKAITREEAQIIFDAGLRFFPIYQTIGLNAPYFTESQGGIDAGLAMEAALALGLPKGAIIYFAVDYDATDHDIQMNIIPYFRKIHEEMTKSDYRTGIYGTRNVCIQTSALGYTVSSFVSNMSAGFSGNLGFRMPDDWAFDQFANLEGENALGEGDARIEIDKNAVSGRDQGISRLVD